MTLREVQPLNEEEWSRLVEALISDPSPDRVDYIQKAVESGRRLKVHR